MDIPAAARYMSQKQILSIAGATAFINLWDGAVRSGKTVASLFRFIHDVVHAPDQGEIVIVAKTGQTADRNIFGPLRSEGLFGPLIANQVKFTPGAHTATICGRKVHVIGAHDARSEERIRGVTIYLAYVDELTLVSQEFFDMLTTRLTVPGAKILATTNPDNPRHWLKKEYIDPAARKAASRVDLKRWHFTIDDNPSLTKAISDRLKNSYPPGLFYRRFILGHWVAAEGAIYDMWDESKHVFDVFPASIAGPWVCGVDYGTANPFSAVLAGLGTDGILYVTAEWRWDSKIQQRQMTDGEYSLAVQEWLRSARIPRTRLNGVDPHYICVDPSAASFKQQLYNDGLRPVDGDNSVLDGIRTVASLLGSGKLKVHRSCTGLIGEIPGYVWDEKKALLGEDAPLKLDDHSCDALRYGVHTTQSIWKPRMQMMSR
jgi:PBSX family phage terminase large subunit